MNEAPASKKNDTRTEQTVPEACGRLSEHACFLLYPVEGWDYPAAAPLTLGELAQTGSAVPDPAHEHGWIPADALATITKERGSKRVWEPGSLVPGSDLYPYIQRLLGSQNARAGDEKANRGTAEPFDAHARVFQLGEPAKKLLRGRRLAYSRETPLEARAPKRLTIELSAAAQRRIAGKTAHFDTRALEVDIVDLYFIVFRTGYGFLIAEVRFPQAEEFDPYLLVEGLNSLSRINCMTWRRGDGAPLADAPQFTFGRLLRSLIGQAENSKRSDRVFTASYLQFSQTPPPGELKRLMIQLARHYNDEYRIRADMPSIETVSHFEGVSHFFSMEGSVTAVELGGYPEGKAPDFLEHYGSITYRRHYLPILLLAYHEFCFLLHATNDATFWPRADEAAAAIGRLQRTRRAVLNFRLCFRFSYVSRISMHNDVNRALRRALGLDWMLEELDRDTAQIDAFLNRAATEKLAEQARRNGRWFRAASVVGAFGITWLTTFTIVKEALEVETVHNALHLASDQVGLFAALAGLLTGVIAGIVTAVKGGHEHSLTAHAAHDNVIHQAGHGSSEESNG